MASIKTICYFGTYSSSLARNDVIIRGLRENGIRVIECKSNKLGWRKYIDLYRKHKKLRDSYDVMIVGFPGYGPVVLAKFITSKPIVFDAFVSQYDSLVCDRKQVGKNSLRSLMLWLTDFLSVYMADVVLLDTYAHIEYFARTFRINSKKFKRVLVGTDVDTFLPKDIAKKSDAFLVNFHGTYIPLQGIEYILDAAKLLEKDRIAFRIIGDGQVKPYIDGYAKKLNLTNVEFIQRVTHKKLRDYINESDVSLGIFGNTEKAKRVIPNKVYEALACGAAVITGRSDAIEEIFSDGEDLLLCNFADGKDLASKIKFLRDNEDLREKIGFSGRKRILDVATPSRIGSTLLEDLGGILKKNGN